MIQAYICKILHATMLCDNGCSTQGVCGYLELLLHDSIGKGMILQPVMPLSNSKSGTRLYVCAQYIW